MGIDLTLCPLGEYSPTKENHSWLAHSRLSLHRSIALFGLIEHLNVTPIPDQVSVAGYFGDTYRDIDKDAYGERLTYIEASELAGLLAVSGGLPGLSDWNGAVLGFMKLLPADTKVILYWH